MKLRTLGIAAFLAVASAVGALSLGGAEPAYAECTCPVGSLREGDDCKTLAECNFPREKDNEEDLMSTVVRILNVIVGVVGVIAVAVIIIGGIFYAISQGDAAKITRAKNTILYGVVGLVISLLAFAIVNFVLSSVFRSGGETSKSGSGSSSAVSNP